MALSAAWMTAGTTDAVAIDPPEIGPLGSRLSPSATSTLFTGTPVLSAVICARIVYVPVPMSWVQQATRAEPSSRSSTLASAEKRVAIQEAAGHAPTQRQPVAFHRANCRIAIRPSEFPAPSWKHSTKCREENGRFFPSSIFGSFRMRSCTGSILSWNASSLSADSVA